MEAASRRQRYGQVKSSGRSVEALRYAVFDVDGTLLDPAGRVHDGLVDGLRRLRQFGLTLMIVTGRSAPGFRCAGIPDDVTELFDHRILVDDGDSVLDRRTGKVRSLACLTPGVIDELRATSSDVVVGACGRLYASGRRAAAAYAMAYRLPREMIELADFVGPATRVTVFGGAGAAVQGAKASSIAPFNATVYRPTEGGKTAGTSALLAEQFGESNLGSVIAFGDADNDAGLLAASSVGVAVNGSSPAAIAAASCHIQQSLPDFLMTTDLSSIRGT